MDVEWFPCARCGTLIEQSSNGLRKYCPRCKYESHLEKCREANARNALEKRQRPPKDAPRYCIDCGRKLPAGCSLNRKHCDACRVDLQRDAARERSRRKSAQRKAALEAAPPEERPKTIKPGSHKPVDKPCKICGAMMLAVQPGTFYCPACRAELAKKPAAPKPEKPKNSHEKIVDLNTAAITKGMTYGKYMDWQRRQKELKEREETRSLARNVQDDL